MTAADDAYAAARQEIARARAAGEVQLNFDSDLFHALDRLPPEISDFDTLKTLNLGNTKIYDISSIANLAELEVLRLDKTYVDDHAGRRRSGRRHRSP
jgi:hypothetical protein